MIGTDKESNYGIKFTYSHEECEVDVKCHPHSSCDDVIRVFAGFLVAAGYHHSSVATCLDAVAEELKDD